MKNLFRASALLTMAFAASFAFADTYALCIGINDYPEPVDAERNPILDENGDPITDDLTGCVNDAKGYQKLLMDKFGVPEDNIRILLDKDATEANFIRDLQWLLSVVKPGDSVFISYSGHGAQIPADDQPEEEDGLLEVLVFYDTLIPDDLIADIARNLTNGGIHSTFVFDNCFSGGINKAAGEGELLDREWKSSTNRWTDGERLTKSKAYRSMDGGAQSMLKTAAKKPRTLDVGSYIFLMAGQEDQPTIDVQFKDGDPPSHGIFSFVLLDLLNADPTMDMQTAIEAVKIILKDAEFEQIPKIEASNFDRPDKKLIED